MHFRMTVALCFLGDEFQVAFRCPKTAAKIYGISECIKNDSVSVAVPGDTSAFSIHDGIKKTPKPRWMKDELGITDAA